MTEIHPPSRNFASRNAFTLIDLLCALVVMLLLGTGLLIFAGKNQETANRVKCARNLRSLGQAMLLYANENRGQYPRTKWDAHNPAPVMFTGVNSADPFGAEGPQANDVSAAIMLLAKTQDISLEIFTCPSGEATKWDMNGRTVLDVSNFPDSEHLGYSFANPYPPIELAEKFRWNNKLSSDFALAADINPGAPQLLTAGPNAPHAQRKRINSRNHFNDGQSVLWGDGHSEFVTTPYVGVNRDNIYTFGDGKNDGIVGPPAWAEDSVLLPVAAPARAFWLDGTMLAVLAIGLILITAMLGIFLFFRRKRNFETSVTA